MIYARDLDGTGSMHICSKEDEGAVAHIPVNLTVRTHEDGSMEIYLGRWRCGDVSYRLLRRKGDPQTWSANCKLPGMKAHLGNFQFKDDAKDRVKFAIQQWLDRLNGEPKGKNP